MTYVIQDHNAHHGTLSIATFICLCQVTCSCATIERFRWNASNAGRVLSSIVPYNIVPDCIARNVCSYLGEYDCRLGAERFETNMTSGILKNIQQGRVMR